MTSRTADTRDSNVITTIDSGSHINAAVHVRRSERPQGARFAVR
jgi:hypothetical protein